MAEVTAAMVKELRERTQAGMMDCKKALVSSNGDMEAAVEYLREKGLAAANKKSGRVAAEGAVESYIHMGGKIGVLVELGCDKADAPELAEAAHMVCLQIAANAPKYIKPEDVPQAEIDAELEIKLNALKEQKGKLPPEQALVGIKKGMAAKFCTQICLLKQDYVADGDLSVEKYLDGVAKTIGAPITVKRFVRLQLGA